MNRQSGISLAEVLVVMAIMGITLSIGALHLNPMGAPLISGTALVESLFREARTKAIANTSAYRVSPDGTTDLKAEFAASCAETSWARDTKMGVELPRSVTITPDDWSVCFSSRGISRDNVVVTLSHPDYGSKKVEVLLGGTTRVLE